MSIRQRPMRPKDVRECMELVTAQPFVGPRYRDSVSHLHSAWLHLLSSDGFCSTTVIEEEVGGAPPRMLGVGASVFATDDFLRQLKAPPFFWIGPELAKRVACGDDSGLLSQKEVQEANSRGGLNLLIWHGAVRAEDAKRAEIWSKLMTVFLDNHRGFLFKEVIIQGESPEHLEGLRHSGGFLLRAADGCYGDFQGIDFHQLARQPHVVGITREIAVQQFGSWVSALFYYEAPRFGFSSGEQRMLLSALAGGTDEELSDQLGVSLSTVKKTWRSAYDRVAACLPELIPGNSQSHGDAAKRGRDKKQHLISYLREHPQELRPVSRKLLQQRSARMVQLP
jgi:hypothetical protein